jgi:hypothetical protein
MADTLPSRLDELDGWRDGDADVLVVGAGLGGIAAALASARLGRQVVLTEPTRWIGGQLTSQAVPPDEHQWIEDGWCSTSYAALRREIRATYRRHWPLTPAARNDARLNPGLARVSRICHEPRVALGVLSAMLEPYLASGAVRLLRGAEPVAASTSGDRITSVTLRSTRGSGGGHESTADDLTITPAVVVDASELGDLLGLAGVEHVVGAEGADRTGEPHAPAVADPLDQQAITWCFAVEHRPGEDHTIDRPAGFDRWAAYQAPFWPNRQLSLADVDPQTLAHRSQPLFGQQTEPGGQPGGWWTYRRVRAASQFGDPIRTDVTLVNWPQIDYWLEPLLKPGAPDPASARLAAEADAAALSRSFLYWLQTLAPRPDGGVGWPGLRPAGEVTGRSDGMALAAYIREARRIEAMVTVTEEHVGVQARELAGRSPRSEPFADSVGIGAYRIDLHPSTAGRTYVDIDSYPFQIPLGALVPVRMRNLVPANKNIGTTHITNGCYRLHPVEWAIGEAAGALAAFCLARGAEPAQVHADDALLTDFQTLLTGTFDVPLAWTDEIAGHAI